MMNTPPRGKRHGDHNVAPSLGADAPASGPAGSGGYGYASLPQATGKKQIEEIIDLLYRRRWIVLVTFLLIAGGVVFYTLRQVPQYAANSLVMVDLGVNEMPQIDVPDSERNFFTVRGRTLSGELFIIQNSNSIRQRVNERLRAMHEEALAAGELGPGDRIYPPSGHATFMPGGRDVSAILISAVSTRPKEAARLANVYAEEYVKVTQEANRSYLTSTRLYLEEQEQKREQELQRAEERLTNHLASGKGLALDPTGSAVVSKITSLETQRDRALIDLNMRSSSLEALEDQLSSISPHLARRISSDTDQRINAARERLAQLEAEKKDILLFYPNATESELAQKTDLGDKNRQIAQLRDEIQRLSEEFVHEVEASGGTIAGEAGLSYVTTLKRQAIESQIEMDGLKSQIEVLNRHIAENQGELSTIPGQSLALARLERDKQHAEQMYNFIVQRLQEIRVTEESEPGYAHVLRRAAPPSSPVYPDKQKNIVLGLFFGLMAGLALALVRDKVDNRIYKPEDLTRQGYEVISTVPDMSILIKEDHGGQAFVEQDGHRYSTGLVTLVNPMSTASETYRQLRTRIQFSRPDIVVQTILVTSASPGEGKTITASNLAVTMAQAGRRTILIDADLRRPSIQDVWGLTSRVGLVQMLYSKPGVELSDFESGVENLSVMPAGALTLDGDFHIRKPAKRKLASESGEAIVTRPAELLGSRQMRDLLLVLRERFDVIVIDTPPVLAASDAVLLSTQADATLVVARAGKTKEGEMDAVAEELDSVGAMVIGTLLNGFDLGMAYGRKYRYQHYTKYGPYAKYGYYNQPKA